MDTPAALLTFDEVRHSGDWLQWGRLATDAPPYLAPEFFGLVRPLAGDGQLLVAEAWHPDGLVGALPLILTGRTLHALTAAPSPGFDYTGSIAGIAAIWGCLRDDDRWSQLVLPRVPIDSPLATELKALARADHFPVAVHDEAPVRYLELRGFERRMNPQLNRYLALAERDSGSVLERLLAPTRDDLDEAAAFAAPADPGAADPRVIHVYHALARLLGPRGAASLSFLRIAGRRVAALFAVEDRTTLYALELGHAPRAAQLGAGHRLIWKVARDAEERGLGELAFVRGEHEGARAWSGRVHERVRIAIYQRSLHGLARRALDAWRARR